MSSKSKQDKRAEAAAVRRKAPALDPNHALLRVQLGVVLAEQSKLEEAVACYRKALALEPRLAPAYFHLGNALKAQDRPDEAIAAFRMASECNPEDPSPPYNLGTTLRDQHRYEEAITAFRQAIKLDPTIPPAHGALGGVLCLSGRFAEAHASTQHCLDLLPSMHPLRRNAMAQLQLCDRNLALEARLPALLDGREKAGGPREMLELIQACQLTQRHSAAAHFSTALSAAEPRQADDLQAAHRRRRGRRSTDGVECNALLAERHRSRRSPSSLVAAAPVRRGAPRLAEALGRRRGPAYAGREGAVSDKR
jgi:tetratricopeptide (TPR) repeat protein